jgi:hypothetical protein
MKMRIQTLFKNRTSANPNPPWERLRADSIIERHGWNSAAEYVKECSRRFRHREPKPYGNGLEMRGDVGTLQRITFEE